MQLRGAHVYSNPDLDVARLEGDAGQRQGFHSGPYRLPAPAIAMQSRIKQEHDGMGGPSGSSKGGASEFVKKLYKSALSSLLFWLVNGSDCLDRMLEDSAHFNIVSWGAKGDSFLVKACHLLKSCDCKTQCGQDMNEFTKTVLPLHFKHSNFASFVRQLNKYDFHKVKASEGGEGIYGDHVCPFPPLHFKRIVISHRRGNLNIPISAPTRKSRSNS